MKTRKKSILALTKNNKRKSQCYYTQKSNSSGDNKNEIRYLCKMTHTIPFSDIIQMNNFKRKFYHLLKEKKVTIKSYKR
jgi:hypothetical protein